MKQNKFYAGIPLALFEKNRRQIFKHTKNQKPYFFLNLSFRLVLADLPMTPGLAAMSNDCE